MTNTIQEKLDEILKDLPPDKQEERYYELYDFMCRSIIALLQDFVDGQGISEKQIEVAKDFAEIKPNMEASKELLKFLDSEDVQRALLRGAKELK